MGLFDNPGEILGNPQGPYLQHAPALQHQVPLLDYSSAQKMARPSGARGSGGRSQDAGTHGATLNALAGSYGQAAGQQSMIPLQLYGQQANEMLGYYDIANQLQGQQITGQNYILDQILPGIQQGLGGMFGSLTSGLGNIKI